MNLLRRDIKNIICEMAAQLDDDFFTEGFARRKNGLVYARKIEATTQKIEIIFFSHPSYDRKAFYFFDHALGEINENMENEF